MKTLEELRAALDAADSDIVAALNRRFALEAQVRALKSAQGLVRVDPARENEIIARVAAATPPADRDTACAVYEAILRGSRGAIETIARGVCERGGKVLLCRATGAATTYLPGGHVEFGETAAVALAREIKEETGRDATVGPFLGVLENTFLQHGKRHCEINLVYAFDLVGADDAVTSAESWIEFLWCPKGDLAAAKLLPAEIARYV